MVPSHMKPNYADSVAFEGCLARTQAAGRDLVVGSTTAARLVPEGVTIHASMVWPAVACTEAARIVHAVVQRHRVESDRKAAAYALIAEVHAGLPRRLAVDPIAACYSAIRSS